MGDEILRDKFPKPLRNIDYEADSYTYNGLNPLLEEKDKLSPLEIL